MHTLQVTLDCGEGCLRRLLGLIEVRGFCVDTLYFMTSGQAHDALLRLNPRDEARSVNVLVRQLNRLHGVEAALLNPHQAEQVFLASQGRGMHWA